MSNSNNVIPFPSAQRRVEIFLEKQNDILHGKSNAMKKIAKENGLSVVDIRIDTSGYDKWDYNGFPSVFEFENDIDSNISELLETMNVVSIPTVKVDKVTFFDELTDTPEEVSQAISDMLDDM